MATKPSGSSYLPEKLMELAELSKSINLSLDQQHIVEYAIRRLAQIMGLSIVSVFLYDKDRDLLYMAASNDETIEKETMARIKFRPGEGPVGKVAQTLKPLFVDDIEKSKLFSHVSDPKYGDKSCRIVPMVSAGKLVGVITMTSRIDNPQQAYHDQALISLFADHIAVGIRNAQLLAAARDAANRDGLTKLYTHRYFHTHLDKEIARAKRYHTRLSLLMLDIDDFKEFNDRFGHLVGDEVLRGVAAIMLANMRASVDIPCRYGGDEFAAIMPETGLDAAFEAAERIRQMVELLEFAAGEEKIKVTLSIGVSEYSEGLSKTQFIDLTDKAMYASKKGGRNRTTKQVYSAQGR